MVSSPVIYSMILGGIVIWVIYGYSPLVTLGITCSI